MPKSQAFSVASISYSTTGLKAEEVILDACTYVRDQEVTVVAEDDINQFFVHGCAGVDEQTETGERKIVTFSIKRDYDILKDLLPNKYADGAVSGHVQKNNAGAKSQKLAIKIRPLGATDDTDAMLMTCFVSSLQNTTATAEGVDYEQIVCAATLNDIDGSTKANLVEYGVDFPAV